MSIYTTFYSHSVTTCGGGRNWVPLAHTLHPITRHLKGPRTAFQHSVPSRKIAIKVHNSTVYRWLSIYEILET